MRGVDFRRSGHEAAHHRSTFGSGDRSRLLQRSLCLRPNAKTQRRRAPFLAVRWSDLLGDFMFLFEWSLSLFSLALERRLRLRVTVMRNLAAGVATKMRQSDERLAAGPTS